MLIRSALSDVPIALVTRVAPHICPGAPICPSPPPARLPSLGLLFSGVGTMSPVPSTIHRIMVVRLTGGLQKTSLFVQHILMHECKRRSSVVRVLQQVTHEGGQTRRRQGYQFPFLLSVPISPCSRRPSSTNPNSPVLS